MNCFVCHGQTSDGTDFHARCVVNSVDSGVPVMENLHREISMVSPCGSCPFRKDRPFWLTAGKYLLNFLRVRRRLVQHCHCSFGGRTDGVALCAGEQILLHGGSDAVFSQEEFERMGPINYGE